MAAGEATGGTGTASNDLEVPATETRGVKNKKEDKGPVCEKIIERKKLASVSVKMEDEGTLGSKCNKQFK